MYWHSNFQFLTRANFQTFLLIVSCSTIFTACQSSPQQPDSNASQETATKIKSLNINLSQPIPTDQSTSAIPFPAVTTASPNLTKFFTKDIDQQRLQLALSMEKQGYIVLSNQLLNEINIENLPESLWDDHYESLASTNQRLGLDSAVLNWLEKANAVDSLNDIASRQRRLSIAVQAYKTNEQYLTATKMAIELNKISPSTLMSNAESQSKNDQLWFLLTQLKVSDLDALEKAETNDTILNWLELAQILHKKTNIADAQAEIKKWFALNPTHPAAQYPPVNLVNLLNFSPKHITKIAVILPTSGALEEIGQAILDGIMINLYQQQSQCTESCDDFPTFTVFDSNAIKNWQHQYQLLADQGFDLVIGPLDKDNVEKAWQVQQKTIPTLALNYLPEQTTSNKHLTPPPFLQFGLSLEEEARQIARQNKNNSFTSILIAHSEEPWARRASQSFIDEWTQTGGKVSGRIIIDAEKDYAGLVKQALHINASNNRRKNIQSIIGKNVSFETRRRQDIDAIILFSQPESARQLVPSIVFHHGADIPIYASHHVYQGMTTTSRDIDLENLIFTEIPWMLEDNQMREQVHKTWPQRSYYSRLFALGVDAYTLINEIEGLAALPSTRLLGTTGVLLHANSKIWAKLTWAQFNNGRPKVINNPYELQ